jgi:hypothetical protein
MKVIDSGNQLQNEALLNEYKGNLFEYLVGLFLSKKFKLESQYLFSINADFKLRLSMYEEYIRINIPEILENLIELASKTSNEIYSKVFKDCYIACEVHLIGKMTTQDEGDLWSEADLAVVVEQLNGIETDPQKNIKISLKLSKYKSFTNTKSAGVKSFFEKYFKSYAVSKDIQNKFNKEIDFQFNKMGMSLYQNEDLYWEGAFDHQWNDHYPTLPGELEKKHSEIVFFNYSELTKFLYQSLVQLYKNDEYTFFNCLGPLMGFSNNDIIQVTTFHKDHKYESISIKTFFAFNNIKISIKPFNIGNHFVEILIDNILLQIRIKPMNKFTTPSYKVNCSIKEE